MTTMYSRTSSNISQPQPAPGRTARIFFSTRHETHHGFTNVSDHAINYRNVVYRTAEHLYEALKFLDHQPMIADFIQRSSDPRRTAQTYDDQKRPDWAKVRLHELERVLILKFNTYPGLKNDLLATGEAQLIQLGSDRYWSRQEDGTGDNEFGNILMRVRNTLRANN